MRTKFDRQLHKLNEEMIQMGTTIEESIGASIEALVKKDTELAKKIAKQDSVVDHMQREIENICFNLLIQQQPVARDLRTITAAMKMVTDMERIGDHAADISEIVILLGGNYEKEKMESIVEMATEAMDMLIKSVDAYIRKDEPLAKWVIDHDDVVDALFVKIKEELVESIRKDSSLGELEIDMLMVAKYLERIADHATNIAEWVLYALDNRGEEVMD